MATPTLRTITGTAVYGDGTGASGVLTFTPQVLFVTTDTVVLPAPVRVVAGNGGTFTVDLAVTDDGAYSPTGWVWQVVEGWPGGRTFTFELPAGDPINYVALVPATSIADPYEAHVHEQYTTVEEAAAAAPVQSVNGEVGDVVLDAADVGALPDDAALNDLSDVETTGAVANDLIAFNGTTWQPTDEPTVYTLSFQTAGAELQPVDGQMVWNAEEGTVDLGLNGVNGTYLHIGQDMVYRIENKSGGPIAKGQVVGFAGTVGNSGKLLGKLYDAAVDPAKTAMGVAAELIPNDGVGYVVAFGKVRKVNTDVVGWNEGDILYAAPGVPGGLTNVAPEAPNAIVTVAALVTKSAQVGELFIRPTFAPRIEESQDVSAGGATTGQVLVYDATAGLWRNETLTASDVGATPSSHLTDLDPHPEYLTEAEGNLLYDALGAAAAAQSAAATYTDSAISTHTADADPHPQYMTRDEVEGIITGIWQDTSAYAAGDLVAIQDGSEFDPGIFQAHYSVYRALQDFPSGSPDPRLWPEVWEFVAGFDRNFIQFDYVGTKNPAVDPLNNYDVFNQGGGTGLFFFFNGNVIPFSSDTGFDAPPIGTVFADPVGWTAGEYAAGLLVEYTLPNTTVLVFQANTTTTGEPTQSPDWDFVEVRPRFLNPIDTLSLDQLTGVEFSGPPADGDLLVYNAGPGSWSPGPIPAHADTHAAGGSDEVTPEAIGAVPTASGLLVVEHGADANVARPAAAVVYWIGSVQPVNASAADLWYDTSGGA